MADRDEGRGGMEAGMSWVGCSRRRALGGSLGAALGIVGLGRSTRGGAACPAAESGRAAGEVARARTRMLLLLRHAEAEPDADGGDRERTLTARGERDAAAVGEEIGAMAGCPDAIVASDAVRARQTAEIVAEAAAFPDSPEFDERIYEADVETLLEVVRDLPDQARCVLLIGHAPGINELAVDLADLDADEIDLPPAGLVHLSLAAEDWIDVEEGAGEVCAIRLPGD